MRSNVRSLRNQATLLSLLALAGTAAAENQPQTVMLQWFETEWSTIEYRMPDFFVAGYSSTWLPPVSKTSSTASTGYDPFERFDLGTPESPTFFGTERSFDFMVDEFHRANALVYVDTILNHNGGRTGDEGFHAAGGWPGFWANWTGGIKFNGGDWGDFNNGTTQSINSSESNYDLWRGDLVGLVDINYTSNNWMVRHPVDDSLPEGIQGSPNDPPTRIPEGTFHNRPNPANARWYPDTDLPATTVNNPGIFRPARDGFPAFNIPAQSFDIHPFNLSDPMAGDPVPENAVALLSRWSQWMLETRNIDGFRLDALKHSEPFYWDVYWDSAVFNRRKLPDGSFGTPFSFGESTSSNDFINNYYIRKDGFGNRDTLDLDGAGRIRNIINARGLGFLATIDDTHFDLVDGFNDGSLGVNHAYSHDNGTRGDGGSAPLWPYEDKIAPWAHAYKILRTGRAIVYHNGRDNVPNVGRFWPRQGIPTALGYGSFYTIPGQVADGTEPPAVEDDRFTRLVQLRNAYGRGVYIPRVEQADMFVFERQGNMVVALTDSYAAPEPNGRYWDDTTFITSFPEGTRLHELTGNADRADVDPDNEIFDTVTVGPGGVVTLRVPRNVSTAREHSTGYVAYGPAAPSGTLSFGGTSDVVLPDPTTVPSARRRLTPLNVVRGSTFSIDLTTTKTDPLDPNWDDNSLFRINQGYQDFNNNGQISSAEIGPGQFEQYEQFLTVKSPLFGTANETGSYSQTINTDDLREGNNYVSVVSFRRRAGGDPILTDFRGVVYVDRMPPDIAVTTQFDCGNGSGLVEIVNDDKTATAVFVFVDLPDGAPIPALAAANRADEWDRGIFRFSFGAGDLDASAKITVVAVEAPGLLQSGNPEINRAVETITVITNAKGDVNLDGVINADDLYALEALAAYDCSADLDGDNDVDADDAIILEGILREDEQDDVLDGR